MKRVVASIIPVEGFQNTHACLAVVTDQYHQLSSLGTNECSVTTISSLSRNMSASINLLHHDRFNGPHHYILEQLFARMMMCWHIQNLTKGDEEHKNIKDNNKLERKT